MERKQKHIKNSVTALFLTHTSHFPHTNLRKMLVFFGLGGGYGYPLSDKGLKPGSSTSGESTSTPRSIASKTFIAKFDRLKNPGDFVGFKPPKVAR